MDSDDYYYRYSKSNVVRISPSPRDAMRWGVWLNSQLLCDSFPSAERAAFCANKNDFSSARAMERFQAIFVPADLSLWRRTAPELPSELPAAPAAQNPPLDCKNRHRRFSHHRL